MDCSVIGVRCSLLSVVRCSLLFVVCCRLLVVPCASVVVGVRVLFVVVWYLASFDVIVSGVCVIVA